MRVLEAVSNAIAKDGIDHLFGVVGDANQDLIVDLDKKHNVKFVKSHHEGSGRWDGRWLRTVLRQSRSCHSDPRPRFDECHHLAGCSPVSPDSATAIGRPHVLERSLQNQGVVDQRALSLLAAGAAADLTGPSNVDYCMGQAFRTLALPILLGSLLPT
jgi:hypothetical protein